MSRRRTAERPRPEEGQEALAHTVDLVPPEEPRPSFRALGFGLLKDGRHVAFEAEVVGRSVKEWTPLCAMPIAAGPARAWWQMGFALLCQQRALLPAEQEANLRDGQGLGVASFSDGAAVAIVGEGRTLTGLAMRLDGATVAEPGIIARGSREYCWSELAAWAALNMLPKRRTT